MKPTGATKDDEVSIYSDIADSLSDAIRATDEAYDIAVEAWGRDDERSMAINSAWAEVETAFRLFRDATPSTSAGGG